MKKHQILRGLCIFFVLFFANVVSAQEIELQLLSSMVSLETIFEEGFSGDMTRIVGFRYEQDYLFGEERIKIGTERADVMIPDGQYFNPLSGVVEVKAVGRITIPGIGEFSSTGTMVGLGGPIAAQTGNMIVSWVQSYSEGTDILTGFYGLASGTGKINVYTGTGEVPFKMILMPPIAQ